VNAVDHWRSDEVIWLDELKALSEQLPSQNDTLVRRMNMSTDARGNGIVDLSVQVSRPEVVAELENSVRDNHRSISSKRVSGTDDKAKLPWAFETRVVFRPQPPSNIDLLNGLADEVQRPSVAAKVDRKGDRK